MNQDSPLPGLDGRYELVAAIGAGSMGTVYRAQETATGLTVAIKLLKSIDPGDVRRFERELAITGSLQHPAIVGYLRSGRTAEGACFLVMEWLEGESLRERLRHRELTLEETLALATRLAAGLAHAHEHGIVHRDVKPANVFLEGGRAEGAKLIDFGIARHVAAGETVTRTGEIVGTPGYVSPEQIRGGRVDACSDVYALGCLLFRCLAGRPVFDDDNVLEMLVRVSRDRAPALASVQAGLPAALSNLVDRMVEREPVDRPADAGEVQRELEALGGSGDGLRGGTGVSTVDLSARPSAQRAAAPDPRSDDARFASAPSRSTALVASTTAPARRSSAWVRRGTLAAILAGAVGVGVVVLRIRQASGPAGTSTAGSAATPSAASGPEDAGAGSDGAIGEGARQAWASIRLGARAAALRSMTARVQHGAASASEHLWLALLSSPGDEAKRQQREASIRVDQLTSFERAVLEAAEPLLAAPSDFARANQALAELAERYRSPELWLVLARLRTQMNDRAGANAAIDRAMTDPWVVAALVERAWVEREFFDAQAARAAATACVDKRPVAADCVAWLSRRAALDGDCTAMDGYARRWIDADPDDPRAHEMLAFALAARGDKDEAVREALEQKWTRLDPAERPAARLRDSMMLAWLHGRFDEAAVQARAAVDGLAADAPLLKRLQASFMLLTSAAELEDRHQVDEISTRVLERASAATPPTPTEAAFFLLFLGANRHPENAARWEDARKDAFARYDAYVAGQGKNVRPFQRVLPWIVGYAAGASTAERQKAAYAALPRYEPLPPPGMAPDDDLVIGRVLAANGERERGMRHLLRAARSCLVLESPLVVAQSLEVMGALHEAEGDNDEARKAYEEVVARWGNATPRSRTVTAAKAGLRRIAAMRGR